MREAAAARQRAFALVLALEVLLIAAAVGVAMRVDAGASTRPLVSATAARLGPDFIDIAAAPAGPVDPAPASGAATGSYTWDCGRNENGHLNTANVVVSPGVAGPPHHVHDYVGNLSTGIRSSVESLTSGGTTCTNGDKSTYYWPVLRTVTDEQAVDSQHAFHDLHPGQVQVPMTLTMTFYGNPRSQVVPMPQLLRGTMGDAVAYTNGGALAQATWTCARTPDRRTTQYPVCDPGDQVMRIFDFPSCWDGRRVDSPDHRKQLVFPGPGGGCPKATFPVPRLRVTAAYDLPPGSRFQIDAFDGQQNKPITDHAFFVNLMPDPVMAKVVNCLNTGQECDDTTPAKQAAKQ